ncbi:MAG: SsrA-binding protein SmpB [Deltaproteobacteria bacterium]|nr:SsrA-binding protein SmpB [Deltaproteobacteria bacterium]
MTPTITNRKASFRFHLSDRFEAGLVLTGSEVKSLRLGRANLVDAYAVIHNGALWLLNCHINPYEAASYNNHEPTRSRKLLLHAHEIERLGAKIKERGLTLVPLRLYFNARGIVKCELALAKGKAEFDKRESIKKRETDRLMRRALK